MNILEMLGQLGVIPVVKIDQASQGPDLAKEIIHLASEAVNIVRCVRESGVKT
jgi:2-keto-3-deoxy-6-phosphogluconate aldolase